jgi:hypothetical protein
MKTNKIFIENINGFLVDKIKTNLWLKICLINQIVFFKLNKSLNARTKEIFRRHRKLETLRQLKLNYLNYLSFEYFWIKISASNLFKELKILQSY